MQIKSVLKYLHYCWCGFRTLLILLIFRLMRQTAAVCTSHLQHNLLDLYFNYLELRSQLQQWAKRKPHLKLLILLTLESARADAYLTPVSSLFMFWWKSPRYKTSAVKQQHKEKWFCAKNLSCFCSETSVEKLCQPPANGSIARKVRKVSKYFALLNFKRITLK